MKYEPQLVQLPDIDIELPTFPETIMNDFYKTAYTNFEEKLKAYLIKNLNELGFEFNSENEFFKFIEERVKRLYFDEMPHYFEFYLDYVDEENMGRFIGSYSNKVNFSFNDSSAESMLTVTFG